MSELQEFKEFEAFRAKYLLPFQDLQNIHWPDKGYIVWRIGTGENVELLHIGVFEKQKGYAKELLAAMLKELIARPPYYSVFGLALSSRQELKEIYRHLGFEISEDIPGPYKGGPSFMFWQDYNILKQKYLA